MIPTEKGFQTTCNLKGFQHHPKRWLGLFRNRISAINSSVVVTFQPTFPTGEADELDDFNQPILFALQFVCFSQGENPADIQNFPQSMWHPSSILGGESGSIRLVGLSQYS